MQMPPDDVIAPHFELAEAENGEPVALFIAKPPDAEQFVLAFGVYEMRQFLGQSHDVLMQMRVALAQYFCAACPTTGDVQHLVSAATIDAEHKKGHMDPPVALCGIRPLREEWEYEPLDPGALPCPDCTCARCLKKFEAETAPCGQRA